jgi:hypothetical protein
MAKRKRLPVIAKVEIAKQPKGEKFHIYFPNEKSCRTLTIIDPKRRKVRIFGRIFTLSEDLYLGDPIKLAQNQITPYIVKIKKASYRGFSPKSLLKKEAKNNELFKLLSGKR